MRVWPDLVILSSVLPWETLRRLLGLPADMAPPGPAELVRMAIDEPRRARLIGLVLAGHPPREAPAGIVLGALDRGTVSRDLAVELLGAVGHGSGYATARALLFEDPEAAPGAGVAMAQMLGLRALADLHLALRGAEERECREGAALGLAEVGDASSAVNIAEAGCDGQIRARVAARCVVRLESAPELWLTYLQHASMAHRRFGTEVVYVFLLADDAESHAQLDALGEPGRAATREALADPELFMLEDKRDALLQWSAP